jgi:hypothetical protein
MKKLAHLNFKKRDNYETPKWCWELILKYVNKDALIWLPFYCKGQAKEYIEELGFKCLHEAKDFFTYEPEHYDVVIDNPPYSIKKEIIEQLIKNGKPFALYLPLETLERKYIKQLDTSLLQVIIPSDRTNFITNYDITKSKPPHKICWFCYKMHLLNGEQLIFQ